MLVLRSKVGESVYLGPDIRVKVVSISGNSVSLAYEAPRDVAIARSELGSVREPKPQPMLPERK